MQTARLPHDTSGSTTSDLIVEEVGTTTTADLGILQSITADSLTGSDVYYLTEDFTPDQLNDGNGVFKTSGSADLKITAQDGTEIEVNLDDVFNLTELLDAINSHEDNGGEGHGKSLERAARLTGQHWRWRFLDR